MSHLGHRIIDTTPFSNSACIKFDTTFFNIAVGSLHLIIKVKIQYSRNDSVCEIKEIPK